MKAIAPNIICLSAELQLASFFLFLVFCQMGYEKFSPQSKSDCNQLDLCLFYAFSRLSVFRSARVCVRWEAHMCVTAIATLHSGGNKHLKRPSHTSTGREVSRTGVQDVHPPTAFLSLHVITR